MNKVLKKIKNDFKDTPDLIIKEIKISIFHKINIIYLESVSSSNKVNDYLLKNIINALSNHIIIKDIASFIAAPNTKMIKEKEISFYLTNGFTIIVDNKIYAIETKADISRSVSTPEVQASIYGPKDAFVENIQINLGLIKRRIKTNSLKIDNLYLGRRTKTNVDLLYFDDITDLTLVNNIKDKLEQIDIDGIIDISQIAHYIEAEAKTIFPTILMVERPDSVCTALLEGKAVLIMDTCPFALILPSFFIDFINPTIDNYNKSVNINFIKILRLFCFFVTAMAPGIYIALINYNQEAIPTKLLLNFAVQSEGVPFPASIEAIIMLVIYELLRESDLRFPSSYGSAISILGALILGEASVKAGIISPIMIIVIALTFISSLIFTDIDMVNASRHYRFLFLMSSSFLGLYGIMIIFLLLITKLCSINSINKPYLAGIAPFDKEIFFTRLFKKESSKIKYRSKVLVKKNLKRKN